MNTKRKLGIVKKGREKRVRGKGKGEVGQVENRRREDPKGGK